MNTAYKTTKVAVTGLRTTNKSSDGVKILVFEVVILVLGVPANAGVPFADSRFRTNIWFIVEPHRLADFSTWPGNVHEDTAKRSVSLFQFADRERGGERSIVFFWSMLVVELHAFQFEDKGWHCLLRRGNICEEASMSMQQRIVRGKRMRQQPTSEFTLQVIPPDLGFRRWHRNMTGTIHWLLGQSRQNHHQNRLNRTGVVLSAQEFSPPFIWRYVLYLQ